MKISSVYQRIPEEARKKDFDAISARIVKERECRILSGPKTFRVKAISAPINTDTYYFYLKNGGRCPSGQESFVRICGNNKCVRDIHFKLGPRKIGRKEYLFQGTPRKSADTLEYILRSKWK